MFNHFKWNKLKERSYFPANRYYLFGYVIVGCQDRSQCWRHYFTCPAATASDFNTKSSLVDIDRIDPVQDSQAASFRPRSSSEVLQIWRECCSSWERATFDMSLTVCRNGGRRITPCFHILYYMNKIYSAYDIPCSYFSAIWRECVTIWASVIIFKNGEETVFVEHSTKTILSLISLLDICCLL